MADIHADDADRRVDCGAPVAARAAVSCALLFSATALAADPRVHATLVVHVAFAFTVRQARAVATAGRGILWAALWKIAVGGQLRVDGEREGGQEKGGYHAAHGRGRGRGSTGQM